MVIWQLWYHQRLHLHTYDDLDNIIAKLTLPRQLPLDFQARHNRSMSPDSFSIGNSIQSVSNIYFCCTIVIVINCYRIQLFSCIRRRVSIVPIQSRRTWSLTERKNYCWELRTNHMVRDITTLYFLLIERRGGLNRTTCKSRCWITHCQFIIVCFWCDAGVEN